MPLPAPPTQRPNNPGTRAADRKAVRELLVKGVLCALIGVAVLAGPSLIASPGLRAVIAQASLVGWFALVLGGALVALSARRHFAARPGD